MENKISRAEALKETKAFIDKYDGTQKDEIQIDKNRRNHGKLLYLRL